MSRGRLFVTLFGTGCLWVGAAGALLVPRPAARVPGEVYAVNMPEGQHRAPARVDGKVTNLESEWRAIYSSLGRLAQTELPVRELELARIAPLFQRLAAAARAARQERFLHYITAIYATFYGNYERAIAEIDKAFTAEPKSSRYLAMKGIIHARLGEVTGQDQEIEAGVRFLLAAQQLARDVPGPSEEFAEIDFSLAYAISSLRQPRWLEVIEHYETYLNSGRAGSTAHAWNNLSVAYRHMGECNKAGQAADQALRVAEFGAARHNKRAAEFCAEMEKLGMITKTIKNRR